MRTRQWKTVTLLISTEHWQHFGATLQDMMSQVKNWWRIVKQATQSRQSCHLGLDQVTGRRRAIKDTEFHACSESSDSQREVQEVFTIIPTLCYTMTDLTTILLTGFMYFLQRSILTQNPHQMGVCGLICVDMKNSVTQRSKGGQKKETVVS